MEAYSQEARDIEDCTSIASADAIYSKIEAQYGKSSNDDERSRDWRCPLQVVYPS